MLSVADPVPSEGFWPWLQVLHGEYRTMSTLVSTLLDPHVFSLPRAGTTGRRHHAQSQLLSHCTPGAGLTQKAQELNPQSPCEFSMASQDNNLSTRIPPICPHRNLSISQRPKLQMPLHWESLSLQHMSLGARDHKHSVCNEEEGGNEIPLIFLCFLFSIHPC